MITYRLICSLNTDKPLYLLDDVLKGSFQLLCLKVTLVILHVTKFVGIETMYYWFAGDFRFHVIFCSNNQLPV